MNIRRTHLRTTFVALAAVAALAGAVTACGSDDGDAATDTTEAATTTAEPTVTDVWARAATNLTGQDMSAVYMTIESGGKANALIRAAVPAEVATTVELHETTAADDSDAMGDDTTTTTAMGDATTTTAMGMEGAEGETGTDDGTSPMMQMRPVEKIEIPVGGQVDLEPGGYHVMLIGLQRELVPGESIEVTLEFEHGDPITMSAPVREA